MEYALEPINDQLAASADAIAPAGACALDTGFSVEQWTCHVSRSDMTVEKLSSAQDKSVAEAPE